MTRRTASRHRRRRPEEMEDFRDQLRAIKAGLEVEEEQDFKFDPAMFKPEIPAANKPWERMEHADLLRRDKEHWQSCHKVGCTRCERGADRLSTHWFGASERRAA